MLVFYAKCYYRDTEESKSSKFKRQKSSIKLSLLVTHSLAVQSNFQSCKFSSQWMLCTGAHFFHLSSHSLCCTFSACSYPDTPSSGALISSTAVICHTTLQSMSTRPLCPVQACHELCQLASYQDVHTVAKAPKMPVSEHSPITKQPVSEYI